MKSLLPLIVGLLICAALSPIISNNINPYYFTIVIYAGINIILAVSLNLVNGLTGQFSMGHAGFMAVGAYAACFLDVTYFSNVNLMGLPNIVSEHLFLFMSTIIGGLFAALLGYLVGLPSLRLKGDYLAIVTLGFGEIIRVLILNIDAIGGARGLPAIPKWTNFFWVYGIAFISVLVVNRLMDSKHGRSFLAVREDEIAAEATGVDTTKYKVRAFVIGAFFAGVAGSLFGHFLTYLNPQTFDFNRSFEIIIMVVLGGMGSTTGAVIAALFLTVLRESLRPLQELTQLDLRMVIYSLMLIILMLTRPNGFLGTKELTDFGPFKRFKKKTLELLGKTS
jgi:branched-chain amino acid transport system permease protein